jgi:hypothetical protein
VTNNSNCKRNKKKKIKKNKLGSNTPRETSSSNKTLDGFESSINHTQHNSIEVSKNDDTEFFSKKIIPEDFMAHMVLGKGSFGEV